MRRVVVVLVLLGMMLGLKLLKAAPVTVGDPLTLAAIGFVVLAAFTIAEVGQLLKLPRVTGYIVTGIVLGPHATNILSQTVVAEMRIFNTLALGLIATTAGLELDLGALRRVAKTLLSTVGLKVLLVFPSVALVFYGLERGFGFLGVSGGAVAAMALIMGTFALGTSPSVSLAVLSETGAKGRLSDLVLGAAVLKDLVVVIVLAVMVAVAATLLSPQARLDASVLAHVGQEIGYTVLVGAVLGVLMILYIRFVHAEMLLFVAAMILVVAELSAVLHLELLLVFIVAGFVVRNFSRFEHELHEPLGTVSLPVFVVFFTIAGASVDLKVLLALLPLALALSALRAGGFWVAARAGGALGGESPVIRQSAWMGYLPLAGVTLGLVGVAAARVPELSKEITSLGMAFVAVNLLIGPITLRGALVRAGEIPQPAAPSEQPRAEAAVAAEPTLLEPQAELEKLRIRLAHPGLVEALERAHRELGEVVLDFAKTELEPWAATLGHSAAGAVVDGPERLEALRAWAEEAPPEDVERAAARARQLFDELQQRLRALPAVVEVPLSHEDRQVMRGDSFATRWRKRRLTWARIATLGRARQRRDVPVRMLARTALEPRLARLANDALSGWMRTRAAAVEELRRFVAGDQGADETRDAIRTLLSSFRERFVSDARHALLRGLGRFTEQASTAGGPALPARRIRYSSVEPEVRAALDELSGAAAGWHAGVLAAQQTLELWVWLAVIDDALERALHEDVLRPLAEACDASIPKVELVRDRVADLRARLDKDKTPSGDELDRLLLACRNAFPTGAQAELRQTRARFARTATGRDLALELRELVDRLPQKLVVLRPGASVHAAASPRDFATRSVALRALVDQKLIGELLPVVDGVIGDVSIRIATASGQIREAVEVAVHALEPGPSGTETLDPGLVEQGVARSVERLDQIRQGLEEAATRTRDELTRRVHAVHGELRTLALGTPTGDLGLSRVDPLLGRAWRTLLEQVRPVWRQARSTYSQVTEDFRRLYGSELSRDIQIRYAKTALDARAIRTYLADWGSDVHLPQSYARLFSLEPLRDRRFFIANRAELEGLVAAERSWLEGGPSSALVAGRHGSGRTSVLNLCQVELATRRVLRPDWSLSRRELGILPVLADDLGCDPRDASLVAALSAQRTVVLIDDLQSWFTADAAGLAQLERFLEIVVETRHDVFWLVTVENEALSLMEEAFSVRQAFGHVVLLPTLDTDTLMDVIDARHRLSGFDVEYPRTLATQLLRRLGRTSERDVFFRLLARAADGNLRLSLVAWRRAVSKLDGAKLVPSLQRVLAVGLPFVPLLPPRPASMLVQLLRFGPMDPARLARGSGLDPGEGTRNASFLESAGLVEPVAAGRTELRVPVALQEAVLRGLREMGAIRSGGLR